MPIRPSQEKMTFTWVQIARLQTVSILYQSLTPKMPGNFRLGSANDFNNLAVMVADSVPDGVPAAGPHARVHQRTVRTARPTKPPNRQAQSPRKLRTIPIRPDRKIGPRPAKVRIETSGRPLFGPIKFGSRPMVSRFNAWRCAMQKSRGGDRLARWRASTTPSNR
jgi:hypothetical protein